MQEPLFDEFPPLSREEWLEKIRADLKGKSPDALRWTSPEGIDLSPVFTAEDLPPREWLDHNFPGHAPYLRGHHPYGTAEGKWEVRHDFRAETVEEVLELVRENGSEIDGIGLVIGLPFREFLFDWEERKLPVYEPRDGIHLQTSADMRKLLAGIDWTGGKQIHLRAGHAVLPVYTYLIDNWTEATGLPLADLRGTLDADPLNRLGSDPSNSRLYTLLKEDSAALLHHIEDQRLTGLRALRVSVEPHHFLGAHAVQQIACALAITADYIQHFDEDHGFSPEVVVRHLHYHFPIDTDFFTEIAKVRAFRVLFHSLTQAYNLQETVPAPYIHGSGAQRSLTSLDPHVNLLRGTTETMSAILGGCDAVSLAPYNTLTENADSHATRIARNIQLVLRDESFFGRVTDPTGGSYYVEYLTWQFADRAWKLFQEIEAGGGYLAAWQDGKVLGEFLSQRQKIDQDVARGKQTLLGVNHYPNAKDTPPTLLTTGYVRDYPMPARDFFDVPTRKRVDAMLSDLAAVGDLGSALEARHRRLDQGPGQTGHLVRLAEPFETIRSDAFEYQQDGFPPPKAFLFTFGPLKMRKARANFSLNVMGCGGLIVEENPYPDEPGQAIGQLGDSAIKAVVFCSSDEAYLTDEAAQWMQEIRAAAPQAQLFVAGKPEGWEAWVESGRIDGCLYAGMNLVTFLNELQEKTEIKEVKHEA